MYLQSIAQWALTLFNPFSPQLMRIPLFFSLVLAMAPMAAAQNNHVADDGTIVPATTVSGPAAQAPGSLTTHFDGGNGFAGNTFDITPNVDMSITGMDFHARYADRQYDIDVYYKAGSSVGYEQDPTAWTLLASGSNPNSNAPGGGTFVDLSGNGVTFSAGVEYGIYMDNVNYDTAGGIAYTNGASTPEVYSNTDLTLEAYSGTRSPAFSGSPFTPRVWNGTLYYETQSAGGPSLSVADLTAGSTCTLAISGATAGYYCWIAYSVTGSGPTTIGVGDVALSPPIQKVGSVVADANGNAIMSATVPANAAGMSIWIQAVDMSGPTLTNALAETIG